MMTKAVRIHGKMDLRLEEIELPKSGTTTCASRSSPIRSA